MASQNEWYRLCCPRRLRRPHHTCHRENRRQKSRPQAGGLGVDLMARPRGRIGPHRKLGKQFRNPGAHQARMKAWVDDLRNMEWMWK